MRSNLHSPGLPAASTRVASTRVSSPARPDIPYVFPRPANETAPSCTIWSRPSSARSLAHWTAVSFKGTTQPGGVSTNTLGTGVAGTVMTAGPKIWQPSTAFARIV